MEGNLAEAAGKLGVRPAELALDILVATDRAAPFVFFIGIEEHVRTLMQREEHTVGSDGILVGDRPHPRSWGTFPRMLETYVREEKVLTLVECVRHMTSAAADRLRLPDRGRIVEGARADLVVFDKDTIKANATYAVPRQAATGIFHVMVNGRFAVEDGKVTGARAGRVLRMTGRHRRREGARRGWQEVPMPDVKLGPDEALLVAARGTGPEHGLMRFVERDGTWRGALLATVNQLVEPRAPSAPAGGLRHVPHRRRRRDPCVACDRRHRRDARRQAEPGQRSVPSRRRSGRPPADLHQLQHQHHRRAEPRCRWRLRRPAGACCGHRQRETERQEAAHPIRPSSSATRCSSSTSAPISSASSPSILWNNT